jgi:hypothetical protein
MRRVAHIRPLLANVGCRASLAFCNLLLLRLCFCFCFSGVILSTAKNPRDDQISRAVPETLQPVNLAVSALKAQVANIRLL